MKLRLIALFTLSLCGTMYCPIVKHGKSSKGKESLPAAYLANESFIVTFDKNNDATVSILGTKTKKIPQSTVTDKIKLVTQFAAGKQFATRNRSFKINGLNNLITFNK